jgi:hypothetical protein
MKRCLLVVVAGLLVAGGCLPEEKVVWSPDGRRAVIIAPDGLYLCDGEGTLSPRLTEKVSGAAWLPDSKRLVVAREQPPLKMWKDVAAFIDEGAAKEVMESAARLRQEILAYQGEPGKFEPTQSLEETALSRMVLMGMYLRDNQAEGLPEKLGPEKWKDVQGLEAPVFSLEVGEVEGAAVKFQAPVRMLHPPAYLRVSPDGRNVAYVTNSALPKGEWSLFVVSLAGGPPRLVAEQVSLLADWSADGRFLAYARATGPAPISQADLRLGTVSRRLVCDAEGKILETFEKAADLAGLLFQYDLKVRCLRDGRILFAAASVQLPSTADDMPNRTTLFAVDPQRPATLVRILPRSTEAEVPQGANYFEVSPDQQRVSIPGPQGVAVVALASGAVEKALVAEDYSVFFVPTWRSPQELCFAVEKGAKLGSPNRREVVLWSSDGARLLSKTWPDEMVTALLKKQGDSEPGKPPAPEAPGK